MATTKANELGQLLGTTIPISLGSAGQVLTVNSGATAGEWTSPAGGADLYAANESSPTAQPSATGTNAIAIGDSAISSNTDSFAFGKSRASGVNSFAAIIGNNSTSFGATGSNSVSIGLNSKSTGGNYSICIGGWYPSATSTYAIAIGNWTNASSNPSTAIGMSCNASSNKTVAIGSNCSSSGMRTTTIGAENSASTNASGSTVIGQNGKAETKGKFVFSNGYYTASGDSQAGKYILRADTTDATPTVFTVDNNSSVGATNQIVLPNNSAYTFSGTIIAREKASSGSDYASWEIKGALLRDANAASTVLGNGIQNKLYATSGASTWAIALTADTTNGGLKIEVTGAASTNIRWVATVNTSEVTYA